MSREPRFWRTSLLWGLALFLGLSFGAFVGERFSGTCMFILIIGLCADLAYRLSARLEERWRGAIVGAAGRGASACGHHLEKLVDGSPIPGCGLHSESLLEVAVRINGLSIAARAV